MRQARFAAYIKDGEPVIEALREYERVHQCAPDGLQDLSDELGIQMPPDLRYYKDNTGWRLEYAFYDDGFADMNPEALMYRSDEVYSGMGHGTRVGSWWWHF